MNLGPLPGKIDQKGTWKVDMRHTALRLAMGGGECQHDSGVPTLTTVV